MNLDKQAKRLQIGLIALENLGKDLLSGERVTLEALQDFRSLSDGLLCSAGIAPRTRVSFEAADTEDLDEDLENLGDEEVEGDDDEIDLDVPDSDFLDEEEEEENEEEEEASSTSTGDEPVVKETDVNVDASAEEPSTAPEDGNLVEPTENEADALDTTDVETDPNESTTEDGSDAPAEDLEVPEPDPVDDPDLSVDESGQEATGGDENLDGGDDTGNVDDLGGDDTDLNTDDTSGDLGVEEPQEPQQTPEEMEQQIDGTDAAEEAEAEERVAAADQAAAEEDAEVRRELEEELKHVGTVAGKVGSFITRTEDAGLTTSAIQEMAELQQSNESLKSFCALDRRLAKSTKSNVLAVRKRLHSLR